MIYRVGSIIFGYHIKITFILNNELGNVFFQFKAHLRYLFLSHFIQLPAEHFSFLNTLDRWDFFFFATISVKAFFFKGVCVCVNGDNYLYTFFSAVLDTITSLFKMDMHSDWGQLFLNRLQHINRFNYLHQSLIIKNSNPGNVAGKNWECWEFFLFSFRSFVDLHSIGQKVLKSRVIFWLCMSALKSSTNQPLFLLAQVLQILNLVLK